MPHEAYCLDFIQNYYDWLDHHWGDSLNALWNQTLGGGGTGAVVDGVAGGIYRLGTPTASDSAQLDWNDIRSLHVNKKVVAEARVRANGGVTDTTRYFLVLRFDGNNYIAFFHDYDSSDIHHITVDGGAPTEQDTDVNVDASFHIFRIECSTTAIHFYIDGDEVEDSPITTNIPDDAGDYLQPFYSITTNADTDPATSMDIDYTWCHQQR